jgi:hypothetical protein
MEGTARRWSWREAGPADRADQRRLFNECFRKDKSVDTFVWKYERNPHGPAVERVAVDDSGRVVGAYAYVPRRFRRDGERIVLMQASDAMVAPEARRQGIFTGLDDVVCAATGELGIPWAFAYSGRLSYNGFLGNGWRDIGRAEVLRYGFRSERGLGRLGRLAPAALLAAGLVNTVYARRDRRALGGQRSGLEPVERFDERVDELCEEALPGQGLTGERDAAWRNWRFVDNPTGRQECFLLPGAGGDPSRPDGLLVAEARKALLAGFTRLAYERGMEEATALLFEHHPAHAALKTLGWRVGTLKRKLFRDMFPFIVRACRSDAPTADEDIRRWWLADGDRDAEHMSA